MQPLFDAFLQTAAGIVGVMAQIGITASQSSNLLQSTQKYFIVIHHPNMKGYAMSGGSSLGVPT